MAVKIQLFGQLKQIAGAAELTIDATDTDELARKMTIRFPVLKNLPYLIAVDRNVIQGNTPITGSEELALLPPYSGG
jgi:molybdopterin converting factor small subunit